MATDIERALAALPALAPWFDGTAAGRLRIAFSGGLDSTVLLHALRGAQGAEAIHIDHGLHPDSGRWRQHCAATADAFGVAFKARSVRVDPTGNREQAARRARYAAWKHLLAAGDVLALAHHADDQAETRLWQMFTGRYPGGMPTERKLGAGRLVRPLLAMRRSNIAHYAKRFGLRWSEDPANADLDFDRNYIRHRLLPLIEARFPDAVKQLASPRPMAAACPQPLPVAAATEHRIAAWLLAAGLPVPRAAVAQIHRQSAAGQDRNPRVVIAPGTQAWRYRQAWHLVRCSESEAGAEQSAHPGCDLRLPGGTLAWHLDQRGLPSRQRLHIRRRQGGERIRPVGRGVAKSVKALFQERRIPPWQRGDWPLLYDAADRLVAVPGLALAAEAAVADGWRPEWMPARDYRHGTARGQSRDRSGHEQRT